MTEYTDAAGTKFRYVKLPKGQPHAGMFARVIEVRDTEVEVHVFRECRTTMRGPVSKRLVLDRSLFPELAQ